MELEKRNIIIKKGLFEEIKITNGNDDDFDLACSKFFEIMKEEVIKFESSRESKCEEWKKEEINKEEIYFESENITKQSPITIIDAPWGTGKTYFVERIIKYFNKNKDIRFFKKIIFLDGWKYSTSKNIPTDLINAFVLAMKSIEPRMAFVIDEYIDKKNNKMFIDYDELSKCFTNFERTIVFIDNIERLGKDAWEVLKSIWRLSERDHFLFVLPMHQKMLNKSISEHSQESFFEKYIDIKYIKFSQDYLGLLINMGFSVEISEYLNNFLNYEIDNTKLSIREIEKRLKANNLLKKSKEDEYLMLSTFTNKIWGSRDVVEKYIENDLNNFIDVLNKMGKYFDEIKKIIMELDEKLIITLKYGDEYYVKKINYIFSWHANVLYSWSISWEGICINLEEEIKVIDENIELVNQDIALLNESVNSLTKKIKTLEKKINKSDKKYKDESQKSQSDTDMINSDKLALLERTLKIDKQQKLEAENNFSIRNDELKKKKESIDDYQKDRSEILTTISSIKETKDNFENVKNNWLEIKKENKKLWKEFVKVIESEKDISYTDADFVDKFTNLLLK